MPDNITGRITAATMGCPVCLQERRTGDAMLHAPEAGFLKRVRELRECPTGSLAGKRIPQNKRLLVGSQRHPLLHETLIAETREVPDPDCATGLLLDRCDLSQRTRHLCCGRQLMEREDTTEEIHPLRHQIKEVRHITRHEAHPVIETLRR